MRVFVGVQGDTTQQSTKEEVVTGLHVKLGCSGLKFSNLEGCRTLNKHQVLGFRRRRDLVKIPCFYPSFPSCLDGDSTTTLDWGREERVRRRTRPGSRCALDHQEGPWSLCGPLTDATCKGSKYRSTRQSHPDPSRVLRCQKLKRRSLTKCHSDREGCTGPLTLPYLPSGPMTIPDYRGTSRRVDRDEGYRDGTSLEGRPIRPPPPGNTRCREEVLHPLGPCGGVVTRVYVCGLEGD